MTEPDRWWDYDHYNQVWTMYISPMVPIARAIYFRPMGGWRWQDITSQTGVTGSGSECGAWSKIFESDANAIADVEQIFGTARASIAWDYTE
jgi:hypothetical protein